MDICIDFDGTCVFHEFPAVGDDVPGAVEVMKELVKAGHRLILFTMRSDRLEAGGVTDPTIQDVTGAFLTDAVEWFKKREIPLYGIQTNPEQKTWTTSPKAYGQIYIDDAALGCPLTLPEGRNFRPFVNWYEVRRILHRRGILDGAMPIRCYGCKCLKPCPDLAAFKNYNIS